MDSGCYAWGSFIHCVMNASSCVWPQENPLLRVQKELTKVSDAIEKVEREISDVNIILTKLEKEIDDAKKAKDKEELTYLRDEKNKLLDEKKQLRDKEKQLRDKENKLLDQLNQVKGMDGICLLSASVYERKIGVACMRTKAGVGEDISLT